MQLGVASHFVTTLDAHKHVPHPAHGAHDESDIILSAVELNLPRHTTANGVVDRRAHSLSRLARSKLLIERQLHRRGALNIDGSGLSARRHCVQSRQCQILIAMQLAFDCGSEALGVAESQYISFEASLQAGLQQFLLEMLMVQVSCELRRQE